MEVEVKKLLAVVLTMVCLGAVAAPVWADVPAGFATAMTGIGTDATAMAAVVSPIIILILGLVVALKLIKRFGNKV